MKKQSTQKKGVPAKRNAKSLDLEEKKTTKLKPIKSKEIKRSKNPSVFEDDDDFIDDDMHGLDELSAADLDDDDDDF